MRNSSIKNRGAIQRQTQVDSPIPVPNRDGSQIQTSAHQQNTVLNFGKSYANQEQQVMEYRRIAGMPEIAEVITDITNECIVYDDDEQPVELNLDLIETMNDKTKGLIQEEFRDILSKFNFHLEGSNIFRNFYVDGRQYYQVMFDPANPAKGIAELRYMDPAHTKRVIEIKRKKIDNENYTNEVVREYFKYEEKLSGDMKRVIKIPIDQVAYCHSGKMDESKELIVGYLEGAIRYANMLRMLEDSILIYIIARAPERRVYYVDTGNLSKTNAEKYMTNLVKKHKNKIVFDSGKGTISEDRHTQSMLEDIWLPRKEGSKGTEVSTLNGGSSMSSMEDKLEHYQNKMYMALMYPRTRYLTDSGFSFGRSNEVSRDEIRFNKMCMELRKRFNDLFMAPLGFALRAKNIVTEEEWNEIKSDIRFKYNNDSFFVELKEKEILTSRLEALDNIEPYIGKFFSIEWVKKNILQQTEDEIKDMQKQMDDEKSELEDLGLEDDLEGHDVEPFEEPEL